LWEKKGGEKRTGSLLSRERRKPIQIFGEEKTEDERENKRKNPYFHHSIRGKAPTIFIRTPLYGKKD